MDTELPKIRSRLQAIPFRRETDVHIALQDLEGVSPDTLVLTPQAFFIVSLMDGSNTIADIQAAFMRKFGSILFRESIEGLIEELDARFFLENERGRAYREKVIAEFRNQPRRSPSHAGFAYEADPERLRTQLQAFFAPEAGGPGEPVPGRSRRPLLGLVAPHIDLRAGGVCFAHAYKCLLEAGPVHTCVILGTCHQPLSRSFALTRKDFDTPLGPAETDNDFIDSLCSRCDLDLFADEFAHRREHTIEFQALFLRLLLPQVRIVPLLCSFGVEEMARQDPAVLAMTRALIETLEACSQPACLLASVDLAHIGPRYGDHFQPDRGTVQQTREADAQLLETVAAGDPEAFAGLLIRDGNSRRICGLPPLYLMLRVLGGRVDGELLHYDHAEVDEHHSFVSFASMGLYGRDLGGR
jgi:AmmeMemoRadiSam system protein B